VNFGIGGAGMGGSKNARGVEGQAYDARLMKRLLIFIKPLKCSSRGGVAALGGNGFRIGSADDNSPRHRQLHRPEPHRRAAGVILLLAGVLLAGIIVSYFHSI
jgi:hypothetical protein